MLLSPHQGLRAGQLSGRAAAAAAPPGPRPCRPWSLSSLVGEKLLAAQGPLAGPPSAVAQVVRDTRLPIQGKHTIVLHFLSRLIGRGTCVSPAKIPKYLEGDPITWSLMGKPISPKGFFFQENLATPLGHIPRETASQTRSYTQGFTEETS